VFEFTARCRKHLLADAHVVIHRTADVEAQEYFHGIVPLGNHTNIEQSGVSCRLINSVIEIQLVGRALTREFSETAQRNLDVACPQFDRIIEVSIISLVPHLDGASVA
jgi:hypothetical protein